MGTGHYAMSYAWIDFQSSTSQSTTSSNTSSTSPTPFASAHSHSPNPTPRSTRHTRSPDSNLRPETSKIHKRTLNTLAARRYRQRRVDQVSLLETSLKATREERDELRLMVARLEAEVGVLRGLVGK
ncbi:unnamed protein product [Diplocarpon coronariae]